MIRTRNKCVLKGTSTPGRGQSENRLLTENGHVTYQSKENDTYDNVQAIILSLQAPLTPRVGSNGF